MPLSIFVNYAKAECSLTAQPIFAAIAHRLAKHAKHHRSAQLVRMDITCKQSTTWPLESAYPAAATAQLAPTHPTIASPVQLAQILSHSSVSPPKMWDSI